MTEQGFIQTPRGRKPMDIVPGRYGVLVRDGWNPDDQVLLEWIPTYQCIARYLEGHVILDIGANIGMFSRLAVENYGAERAHCYEPEAGAYSVLEHNMRGLRGCTLHPHAVGIRDAEVLLSLPVSGNATAATTTRDVRGRQSLPVQQKAFKSVLDLHKPTLVKVDCEGAELGFLYGNELPSHVKFVVAELHREHDGEAACQRVISSFKDWTPVVRPKSYSFARCWLIYFAKD